MKVSYELAVRLLRANNLDPSMRPLSQPSAVSAARSLLGDDVTPPPDMAEWVARWTALRLLDTDGAVRDARGLAFRAGRSALLSARPGAVAVRRDLPWLETGRRFNRAGIAWANTGDSAANRLFPFADQVWPVFYVEDVRSALQATDLTPLLPGERGPRTLFIPFDGASEAGRWQDEAGPTSEMWFAAPWQVVIDCFAGADRMLQQADRILDSWEDRSG